jgi:hypothetical protein
MVRYLTASPTYTGGDQILTALWYRQHIFHTYNVLFGFLEPGFFKLGQHLTTPLPNFALCPCYKTEDHVRGVSSYKVHKTSNAENSPKNWWFFFFPKKMNFVWFCVVTLDGHLWPFISSSSQLGFAHYSYRYLLFILEFLLSI